MLRFIQRFVKCRKRTLIWPDRQLFSDRRKSNWARYLLRLQQVKKVDMHVKKVNIYYINLILSLSLSSFHNLPHGEVDTKYLGGYHGYSIWKGNINMKRIHVYLLNYLFSKVPNKWPGWVTYVACLSHLLIIINSSVNFFIYFIKYQQRKSSARGSSLEMETMVRWAAAATLVSVRAVKGQRFTVPGKFSY